MPRFRTARQALYELLGAVLAIAAVLTGAAAISIVTAPARSPGPATTSGQQPPPGEPYRPARPVVVTLPPRPMSYLGVFEPEGPLSYTQVTTFANLADQAPDLALYYSSWAEKFETRFAQAAYASGAYPMVQLDARGISLAQIAAGKYDAHLEALAEEVADFGYGVVMGFGHEMNGSWYSWGYKRQPPAEFVAAWKHIVTIFHRENAYNVTWLWTVNREGPETGPLRNWWPGKSYVTWIGIDGYYYTTNNTYESVFQPTISAIRKFSNDPILISETSVGPQANQQRGIENMFTGIRDNGDLGLVWFDKPTSGSLYHQDWRIEDASSVARAMFRIEASRMNLERPG